MHKGLRFLLLKTAHTHTTLHPPLYTSPPSRKNKTTRFPKTVVSIAQATTRPRGGGERDSKFEHPSPTGVKKRRSPTTPARISRRNNSHRVAKLIQQARKTCRKKSAPPRPLGRARQALILGRRYRFRKFGASIQPRELLLSFFAAIALLFLDLPSAPPTNSHT